VLFERGVRTYDIVPNTLQLQSDSDPTIVLTGEATQYTLVDNGRVLFTANDTTGNRNITLDPDDIVIERPMANSITVVTQRSRLF
jgi:lipopolysaccharide export system protein LptA